MSKYLVWQVECIHCEGVFSFGEDAVTIPETCPDCGESDWEEEEDAGT